MYAAQGVGERVKFCGAKVGFEAVLDCLFCAMCLIWRRREKKTAERNMNEELSRECANYPEAELIWTVRVCQSRFFWVSLTSAMLASGKDESK